MVEEEIDWLLEAGFIYPVNNSEWVSPIVVVPKKVGADGKVKIRGLSRFPEVKFRN
jgi:disulfide oxidoreductase YuzD